VPGEKWEPAALLFLTAAATGVSAVGPRDPLTWWLEAFPVLFGAPLLVATRRRFPLTPLLYRLLFVHALILLVGAHYTYAEVPLGFWVRDWLGLARNHYDRLGHLAQGFVPAILVREILLRRSPLKPGKWLFTLTVCVCLAVSAFYELIEWWAALAGGASADAFLGTQGDPWDTQNDMFLALVGGVAAQLLLAGVHGRSLARLGAGARGEGDS
jgi:putative membrane protein